jgi:prepilin peptidase CpaA
MPLVEIARWTVLVFLTLVLGYAAAVDVKERRIPNWTVLAVAGLFVGWAVIGPSVSLVGSLAAAVIVFIFTVGLYLLKVVGAGDSKLVTAVALFIGLQHLLVFALMMSVVGGMIALFMLATSPRRVLVIIQTRGEVGFGRSVPYGAAIALAAVATLVPQVTGVPLW